MHENCWPLALYGFFGWLLSYTAASWNRLVLVWFARLEMVGPGNCIPSSFGTAAVSFGNGSELAAAGDSHVPEYWILENHRAACDCRRAHHLGGRAAIDGRRSLFRYAHFCGDDRVSSILGRNGKTLLARSVHPS